MSSSSNDGPRPVLAAQSIVTVSPPCQQTDITSCGVFATKLSSQVSRFANSCGNSSVSVSRVQEFAGSFFFESRFEIRSRTSQLPDELRGTPSQAAHRHRLEVPQQNKLYSESRNRRNQSRYLLGLNRGMRFTSTSQRSRPQRFAVSDVGKRKAAERTNLGGDVTASCVVAERIPLTE